MTLILADTSGLYSHLNGKDHYHIQVREFYDTLPTQTEIIVIEYIWLKR